MANKELETLMTHVNGATDLQETRSVQEPVSIDEPDSPNPSPLDVRTGKYKNVFESNQGK